MGAAVTVGTFDGVHRGHQAVLGMLREESARLGLRPLVVTFDRHPLETVAPERAPGLIMEPDSRDALLCDLGVLVERVEFTEEVRRMTAAEWMRRLVDEYDARLLLLGYDNTFGSDGMVMTPDDFRAEGRRIGLRVEVAPAVAGCSSSAVRMALAAGDTPLAASILGRPFSICGSVVRGRQLGRTIGMPTANIETAPRQLVPAPGVYAARAIVPGSGGGTATGVYDAVVNIGTSPTVTDCGVVRVEAHLLGFSGDLYGRDICLEFGARVRDERKFDSLDALRVQIEADIKRVRNGDVG